MELKPIVSYAHKPIHNPDITWCERCGATTIPGTWFNEPCIKHYAQPFPKEDQKDDGD